MIVIIAAQEPHLRGPVAPRFEAAPYYLAVDTLACRTTVFLHPVQYEVACSPASLVQRLRRFAPEAVVAGSFPAEVEQAAAALRICLKVVRGRAADAVQQCLGGGGSAGQC
jgi:hypothetical protein